MLHNFNTNRKFCFKQFLWIIGLKLIALKLKGISSNNIFGKYKSPFPHRINFLIYHFIHCIELNVVQIITTDFKIFVLLFLRLSVSLETDRMGEAPVSDDGTVTRSAEVQ